MEGFGVLWDGVADLPRLVTGWDGYQSFWTYLVDEEGLGEVFKSAIDHLQLVATPMIAATFFGITMGILAHRVPSLRGLIIGFSSILLTVPSLALFSILIPIGFIGIGDRPAMVALFLYALLPILRNTIVGLEEVDSAVSESAKGMDSGISSASRKSNSHWRGR